MSIKNRVKKKVQNQPHEFQTGDLIKYFHIETGLSQEEYLKIHNYSDAAKVFIELELLLMNSNMTFSGVVVEKENGLPHIRIGSDSLEFETELIAFMIQVIAQRLNVSIDKVLGKVMASIYESEKEESQ